jgi:hypothetical protein
MAEAKYVARCREVVWLWKLLYGLFGLKLEVMCIWCYNQNCMKLSKNLVFHDRSKHIEIKYHYIKDMVQRGEVRLQYVIIEEQVADMLTKPLSRTKFEHFKDKLGMVSL